jgi:hypothetical protein
VCAFFACAAGISRLLNAERPCRWQAHQREQFVIAKQAEIIKRCYSRPRPSGEIGRHSGLKIRRLPERGRTGSIPVSGTSNLLYSVARNPGTRIAYGFAGFLLSNAILIDTIKGRRFDYIHDRIFATARQRREKAHDRIADGIDTGQAGHDEKHIRAMAHAVVGR